MLRAFVLAAISSSPDSLGDERRQVFEAEAIPLLDGLYGGALSLAGNRPDADDLMQETVLNAYRNFHRYQPGTNLRAWLNRIMVNAFISRYRRKGRSPERANVDDLADALTGSTPEDATREANAWIDLRSSGALDALKEELGDELKNAIESLPDDFRDVLILNAVNGLTYKEVAEAMGVAMGTVMSRVSRAKSMIRERLQTAWQSAEAQLPEDAQSDKQAAASINESASESN